MWRLYFIDMYCIFLCQVQQGSVTNPLIYQMGRGSKGHRVTWLRWLNSAPGILALRGPSYSPTAAPSVAPFTSTPAYVPALQVFGSKHSHCFCRTALASQFTSDASLPVTKDNISPQEWQTLIFPEPQPPNQPHNYLKAHWPCTVMGVTGRS